MGIPTKHSDTYAAQLEDRIAALEAENKRLRDALAPFAKHGQRLQDKTYSRVGFFTHCLPCEMWNSAAKAMEDSDAPQG